MWVLFLQESGVRHLGDYLVADAHSQFICITLCPLLGASNNYCRDSEHGFYASSQLQSLTPLRVAGLFHHLIAPAWVTSYRHLARQIAIFVRALYTIHCLMT
ncbi:hypothetical protein VNO77_39253 [Canavalia gladiata]|uniref:Uncharacterized protein n=1 Tax=Canavalia gladiata TaxID=3824 RepID=A0AAN9PVN2_CANGL